MHMAHDTQPATKALAAVADGGAAQHGYQAGNGPRHRYLVGGESELVFDQGRVQVLRAV